MEPFESIPQSLAFVTQIFHGPLELVRFAPDYKSNYDADMLDFLHQHEGNEVEVELEEDIYSIAFLAFLKGNLNNKRLSNLVMKCTFCFTFQIMIVGLLMLEYLNVSTAGGGF